MDLLDAADQMRAAAARRQNDPEFAARVRTVVETVMQQSSDWDQQSVFAGACLALWLAES